MPRPAHNVTTHTFRSKVQQVKLTETSETFRVTLPQALVAILDVGKGDELVWTYDASSRRITVSKGERSR
ncbi:MAG: hypothetical protein WCA77_00895 [Thermoplasmata archaeon]